MTVLERHGYMRSDRIGTVPKPYRPKSIGDAREIIRGVFERNKWDRDMQADYLKLKQIDKDNLDDLSAEEIRKVISQMEKSRMLIFAN